MQKLSEETIEKVNALIKEAKDLVKKEKGDFICTYRGEEEQTHIMTVAGSGQGIINLWFSAAADLRRSLSGS